MFELSSDTNAIVVVLGIVALGYHLLRCKPSKLPCCEVAAPIIERQFVHDFRDHALGDMQVVANEEERMIIRVRYGDQRPPESAYYEVKIQVSRVVDDVEYRPVGLR